jgi:hypothetical protein
MEAALKRTRFGPLSAFGILLIVGLAVQVPTAIGPNVLPARAGTASPTSQCLPGYEVIPSGPGAGCQFPGTIMIDICRPGDGGYKARVAIPGSTCLPSSSSVTFYAPTDSSDTSDVGSEAACLDQITITNQTASDPAVRVILDDQGLTIDAPPGLSVQMATAGVACVPAGGASVVDCSPASLARLSSLPFTTADRSAGPTSAAVTFGWNLVGGPEGTILTYAATLYGLAPDGTYRVLPSRSPLHATEGYWALFYVGAYIPLPDGGTGLQNVALPVSRYTLIGSPFTSEATVSGADAVYTYDATSGTYHESAELRPGQGPWAYSAAGGTATIAAAGPQ